MLPIALMTALAATPPAVQPVPTQPAAASQQEAAPGTPDRISLSPIAASPVARAQGRQIRIGDAPYRFQGLNVYDLADVGVRDPQALRRTLQTIADSGATVVRFWAFHNRTPADIQRVLDTSREMHLNLRFIPVLGNHWSYSPDGSGNKDAAWYREGYRQAYRPAAEALVTALRDRPEILMWELMNEPESSDHEALSRFVTDMSRMIHSRAPHLVSIGTLTDQQAGLANGGFERLHAIPTVDVVTWHDYALDRGQTAEEQARNLERGNRSADNILAIARRLDKPVFVGEVGARVTHQYRGPQFRSPAVAMQLVEQRVERAMAGGAIGALGWGPQPNGRGVDGDGYGFDFTTGTPEGEAVRRRMTRPYPAP